MVIICLVFIPIYHKLNVKFNDEFAKRLLTKLPTDLAELKEDMDNFQADLSRVKSDIIRISK